MKNNIMYIAIGVAIGVAAMWAIGKFGKKETGKTE